MSLRDREISTVAMGHGNAEENDAMGDTQAAVIYRS